MEWVRQGTLPIEELAFAARFVGGQFVFRAAQSLLAWGGIDPAPTWMQPLQGDRMFGAKLLAATDDRVATMVELGATDSTEVAVFAGPDGTPLWRRGYGGIASTGGFAGASGSDRAPLVIASQTATRAGMYYDERSVTVADLVSGEILWKTEAAEGDRLGTPVWVGDDLVVPARGTGGAATVQVHDGGTGAIVGTLPITLEAPVSLYSVRDTLIVSGHDGMESFVLRG